MTFYMILDVEVHDLPMHMCLDIYIYIYILYASRNPAALLNSSRLDSCRCYCFLCLFSIFWDIDCLQFYIIFVILDIILESFWGHFCVILG